MRFNDYLLNGKPSKSEISQNGLAGNASVKKSANPIISFEIYGGSEPPNLKTTALKLRYMNRKHEEMIFDRIFN